MASKLIFSYVDQFKNCKRWYSFDVVGVWLCAPSNLAGRLILLNDYLTPFISPSHYLRRRHIFATVNWLMVVVIAENIFNYLSNGASIGGSSGTIGEGFCAATRSGNFARSLQTLRKKAFNIIKSIHSKASKHCQWAPFCLPINLFRQISKT